MAVLFISHASRDDRHANTLVDWLGQNGFSDIFVDHQSIAGGDKWRDALKASANSCRIIICLITENWLGSQDCYGEFVAAGYMGKRILPLFVLPLATQLVGESKSRFLRVCGEDQGIDVSACVDPEGILNLARSQSVASQIRTALQAAGANTHVGLDPEAFAVDPRLRPIPFPGLASFGDHDADAALFYGRSREIAETLECLRQMRASGEHRPLVILGASGAGKSSLLKAGIIPRLRRESPAWLPLRCFRPGADPLLNFAEAISQTSADYGQKQAPGHIRDRLLDAWAHAEHDEAGLTANGLAAVERAIESEGAILRSLANRPGGTILISVDQAEEIARSEGMNCDVLADYLRAALAHRESPWQLAFSIRSDSFPELQRHARFKGLDARGYDLRSIPVFRFENVVEQPAKRYGVSVDPALVDAMVENAPKDDALPLLAFALQRLWQQYAVSGRLTKDAYDRVGGLNGLIEDAAERALHGVDPSHDMATPTDLLADRLTNLGMSTFVPALAQISESGATIRRIAAWKDFSDEQHELLSRFDRWRLVVRKGADSDGGTVEVAHEALFREWTRLKEWLEPERARLEVLRLLQLDAATWKRNGRDAAFLNHRDRRLTEARQLEADQRYAARLTGTDHEYLAACASAEVAKRSIEKRNGFVVAALAVVLVAAMIGWWQQVWLQERFFRFRHMGVRALALKQERELAVQPGATFTECLRGCPPMIVLPAGAFMMGSPATEKDRSPTEDPRRQISFTRVFAVSKYLITFAEWDACVSAGACSAVSDSGWGRGDRPAINISWDDAQQYVSWLVRSTGKKYRLLTEAEWEYAARGGTTTAYFWGDDIGAGNANCNGCGSSWDFKQSSPVGSFKPNPFGLYDMHGNVWQWVADCHHDSYHGAPADGSSWEVNCLDDRRMVRGGAWNNRPSILRSSIRDRVPTGNRGNYLGFRIARSMQ